MDMDDRTNYQVTEPIRYAPVGVDREGVIIMEEVQLLDYSPKSKQQVNRNIQKGLLINTQV